MATALWAGVEWLRLTERTDVKGLLEALLTAIAGFLGGFVSTLASNGSAVTLPALEFFGLPEHTANGTNRLSVVALGLVGTIGFYREGLVDWRKGGRIAVLVALGIGVGSLPSSSARRSWTPSSSRVCSSSSGCSSSVRAAGSKGKKECSDLSVGVRQLLTSPSASTRV